ncbi:MAG: hypothetical protein Q9211_003071, partial [Gyalolechia sp. 1 TL-2023]
AVALCTTLTPEWDSNGLYRTTLHTVTFPCPNTPNPVYPVSRTADPTQGLLQGSPTAASSDRHHHGKDKGLRLALGLTLGLGISLIIIVALMFCIWRARHPAKVRRGTTNTPVTAKPNNGGAARGNQGAVAGDHADQHKDAANHGGIANGAAQNGTEVARDIQGHIGGTSRSRSNHAGQGNDRDVANDGGIANGAAQNGSEVAQDSQGPIAGNHAGQYNDQDVANNDGTSRSIANGAAQSGTEVAQGFQGPIAGTSNHAGQHNDQDVANDDGRSIANGAAQSGTEVAQGLQGDSANGGAAHNGAEAQAAQSRSTQGAVASDDAGQRNDRDSTNDGGIANGAAHVEEGGRGLGLYNYWPLITRMFDRS